MGIKDYYTRDAANTGNKMYLQNPDGTISETDYLIIAGIDSDPYTQSKDRSYRNAMDIAQIDDIEVRTKALRDSTIDMYVSLVLGWSFEEPLTKDAITEFLIESPNNATRIDKFASDRKNFFTKKSTA